MSSVIGGLVSLSCALIVLGLIGRLFFNSTALLKIGGVVFAVALLPSIAVGLYNQMAASTPGGMSGFGTLIGLLALSAIAFVVFRLWLAFRGSGPTRGAKVERKRLLRFDEDED